MSSEPVIILENVSKEFYKQEQRTFKELLPALFSGKKTSEWFYALKDITLSIRAGESVGIMGPNGSGKSTLLKLIAGVTKPTVGRLTVRGRIAPLIELGAGFHPELTGRENVYLNGVILGMSRAEVEAQFDNIVEFAELSDFIDSPVKHYSSGMYLRLAFSVAVHTQPDILLVDEILAVGDQKFQQKCLAKIAELQRDGLTIIMVSHSPELIAKTCHRQINLAYGKLLRKSST